VDLFFLYAFLVLGIVADEEVLTSALLLVAP